MRSENTSPIGPHQPPPDRGAPRSVIVVGSGISGLAAAWLLARRHRVTLLEAAVRPGGHSHTVDVALEAGPAGPARRFGVDTGFIVYNESTYPNLVALFEHLGVATAPTTMGFSVSLDDGALEYSGDLRGMLAQPGKLLSPRYWSMWRDLVRFYREAPRDAADEAGLTLDDYLVRRGYGAAFREDHLYPMAAAIWSTPAGQVGATPFGAFVRFCQNHHLLHLGARPPWRTVVGGSREYVRRMLEALDGAVVLGDAAARVERGPQGVRVLTVGGALLQADEVVLATHADQALRLLAQPRSDELETLGAFRYSRNEAVLHGDPALMPRRRATWSAWNYLGRRGLPETGEVPKLCVSYWMNALQPLGEGVPPCFVTLNPHRPPEAARVWHRAEVEHPIFDLAALAAQSRLGALQGRDHTWFCGAYFGAGFHEDGLQAGLAVAEAIGGVRRPWTLAQPSGRIAATMTTPWGRATAGSTPAPRA